MAFATTWSNKKLRNAWAAEAGSVGLGRRAADAEDGDDDDNNDDDDDDDGK
jgi:hypothetical protein